MIVAKLILEEGCMTYTEIAEGPWIEMMELYNGSEYAKLFKLYGFPDRRMTGASHGSNNCTWLRHKTGRQGDLRLSVIEG